MDHGSKLNFGTVQKGVIFPPKIEMVVPSEKRLKIRCQNSRWNGVL